MELPVEKILRGKNIRYKLVELSEAAYTVGDVVEYSGGSVNPEEICKTLVLEGKKSGKLVGILLKGGDRIDFKKAREILGESVEMAAPEGVKRAAGVEPGAVCPFLLEVPLYVDEKVATMGNVNCGSGQHLFGLEFDFQDLAKAVKYEVVSLAK